MSDREQEFTRSEENLGPECAPGQDVSNTSGIEGTNITGQSPLGVEGFQGQGTQGQQQGQGVAQTVSQDVNEATQKVQQKAQEFMTESKQKAQDFVSESSDTVAETLDNVCECLRNTADEMSQHEHPMFGKYVRSAADTMAKFSDSLKHKDMDFFVHRTEDLARHQPGVFLGGAFTMGFALGRFLKGKSTQARMTKREHAGVTSGNVNEPEIWH